MSDFNLLVVEDDSVVVDYMYRGLTALRGVHVDFASSESEAMRCIGMKRYDLAFVDIHLKDDGKDRGGISVIHALHSLKEDTSIVVVSGTGAVDAAIAAYRAGIVEFLEKGTIKDGAATVESLVLEFINEHQGMRPNLLGPYPSLSALLSDPQFIPIWESNVATTLGTSTPILRMALHAAFDGLLPILRKNEAGEALTQVGAERAMTGDLWSRKLGAAVRIGLCFADLDIDQMCGVPEAREVHSKDYRNLKVKLWIVPTGQRQDFDESSWVERTGGPGAKGASFPI